MRIKTMIKTVAAIGALAFAGAASANSLTFGDVTFTTTATGSNTMTLQISGAASSTSVVGGWANALYLKSFAFKITGATAAGTSLTNWVVSSSGLDAWGCDGIVDPNGFICFTSNANSGKGYSISDSMTFNINFGGSPNFSLPHLKVYFTDGTFGNGNHDDDYKKVGDLLSRDIPRTSVPEPATLGLLGLGLAGVGFARRRKVAA